MSDFVRNVARGVSRVIHSVVNDFAVDPLPQDASRSIHQRLDEELRVKLVDIILIQNRRVEAIQCISDLLREIGLADVENVREKKSQNCDCYGHAHQQKFGATASRFASGFGKMARPKHRRKEVLEAVADAYQG